MLKRYVPLAVCLALAAGAALAQNPQGVGYAVEFASSSSGQFQIFPENVATIASSSITNTGPGGPNQLAAKPDGSKFYIMGASSLDDIDPGFATPKAVNGLHGTLSHIQMTPDGRYLLVSASQGPGTGNVYVIDTSNDSLALNQTVTGTVIGIAVSRDSRTVWILSESTGTYITIVNLNTLAQSGQQVYLQDPTTGQGLGGAATSITLSPLGLLYVTAANQILEINPSVLATCQGNAALTCSPATVISVNATPGPLQFTPDSAFAYFVNQTPNIGGRSIYRIAFPSHNTIAYLSTEAFDSIMVAGQNRILAHSPADTTLWDVATDLSTVTVSTLQSVLPATTVYSAVLSGELPSAKYLFVMAGGASLSDVYLVDLSTNAVSAQAAASLGLGPLQFVFVPSQTPSGFTTPLTYNANQPNLATGATAAPLIARVLDQNGNPVYNVPVTFSGDPSLTINPTNATTNADGYVQTIVTMGSSTGNLPVTLTAGSNNNTVTATFSLAIPGAGNPGGPGGPGGPQQLTIVTGNGQLFLAAQQKFGDSAPNTLLTVQLFDANGKPFPNQNVTFTVTGPAIAAVSSPQTTTDNNGMASTPLFPGFPGQSIAFASTTIVATATDTANNFLGSVTFTETIYQTNQDGTGTPSTLIQQPANYAISGGEGDVIPGAIQIAISDSAFGRGQLVPNIGIRIADPTNPNLNGPGVCQGGPLSDQNGIITCNFIPACSTSIGANGSPVGLGMHGFLIEVGEFYQSEPISLNITPGSTQQLSITSGNNQNGSPDAILSTPLNVTATDSCGTPIPNVGVTWKITGGSGTLSSTSGVTNAGGNASTKLTLGTGAGSVTVTATINGTTKTVTFKETINAVVGALTLVSGGSQTAFEGAAFAQPLVFALNDNKGNGLSGYTVNFNLAGGSGSASLSTNTATTNSLGQVSVNVTAGNAPGTVTVKATYSTFTTSANLTVTAPGPSVSSTSFVNAASLQAGLVPCGLATVTGAGLAPNVTGVVSGNTLGLGPLPYTLQGVSITVDGTPAPILSVSNQGGIQQVNFQTPCEAPSGSGTVVVQVNSATTTVTNVTVYPIQPGIVTYAGPSGTAYAWIISAKDGSYLTPSNPAHAGQTYYLVATGLGQTTPPATTNAAGTGGQTIPVSQIVMAIDNIGVPVTSVQYVQGSVGVYIITFTIPTTVNNGQPFPTGTNLPVSLGGIAPGGQTIYDNSPVAIPSIN